MSEFRLSDKIFRFERGNTKHGKSSKILVPSLNSGARLLVKDVKKFIKLLKEYLRDECYIIEGYPLSKIDKLAGDLK